MDHRVLHRDLKPLSLAGAVALPQRGENADRHQHAGAGVAEGWARLDRRAVAISGDAGRAARGLRDHVEGEVLLVWATRAEAFDLAVNNPRVQLLDDIIAEAQSLNRAGRHVLDRDIGLFEQLFDDLEPARRFEVERDRFLIRVELVKIPWVVVGLPAAQPPAGIAQPRVLDLDHLAAEPGERLGAGRPRLELREIDDPHAFE